MALSPLLSSFLLWSLIISTATAFDITKILNQYPEYAAFNEELSKTGVADEINNRKSVTVLVVSNGAMSPVTGQKEGSIADIMRIHVVLDYYDSAKIKTLTDETTLTTLYQTTGSADKEQGFIIVAKDNNEIRLGSAVSGSQMSAKVNKVVTSVPYDISVIEISSPIIPSEIDASDPPTKSSASQSPQNSPSDSPADSSSNETPSPAPSHKHKHNHSPAPSPSDADAPSDDDDNDDADDADADDSDVDADDADADAPSDDADNKSASSRNAVVSGVILLASFVATL